MGLSFGTTIGIKTITKTPQLYVAYIGVAQIVNQFESEKIAYQYMINEYTKNRNRNMVKKITKFNLLETEHISKDYYKFRDKPMHELGIGTMHNMKSVISGIFFPLMKNNDYTLSERINIWKAKSELLNKTTLMEDAFETDFSTKFTEFEIPIYFFHGIYDYTVNYDITKEYYKTIKAPIKGFYTFYESAHSPIFEESEKLNNIIIKDILGGVWK
ncbi:MAG: hypothetical protein LBJ60_07420 [Tannerellaceae bacterium]|jgi:pimeloyl-ACP methyl ester carboxylesterase|nr:hypothetical protein [Tannerellaceae bacterium]